MSILKRKKKEDETEDELERILTQLKDDSEDKAAAVVTIQIAGLKELVKAVEQLTEALKKCNE